MFRRKNALPGSPLLQRRTTYRNTFTKIEPVPILADYPEFVQPLMPDLVYKQPSLIIDENATIKVSCWHYSYNLEAISIAENFLDANATILSIVHPLRMDEDSSGAISSTRPAGCMYFGTVEKNRVAGKHMKVVLNPFLHRLRHKVKLMTFRMPGQETEIMKKLYKSIDNKTICPEEGENDLRKQRLTWEKVRGVPIPTEAKLSKNKELSSWLRQMPSSSQSVKMNGSMARRLSFPISSYIDYDPSTDILFYEREGYAKARDFLISLGVRHILLCGYSLGCCVMGIKTRFLDLFSDFNVFIVGDATIAKFPASTTPAYSTQVGLANLSISHMITQTSWIEC